jgi:hypothetical protein
MVVEAAVVEGMIEEAVGVGVDGTMEGQTAEGATHTIRVPRITDRIRKTHMDLTEEVVIEDTEEDVEATLISNHPLIRLGPHTSPKRRRRRRNNTEVMGAMVAVADRLQAAHLRQGMGGTVLAVVVVAPHQEAVRRVMAHTAKAKAVMEDTERTATQQDMVMAEDMATTVVDTGVMVAVQQMARIKAVKVVAEEPLHITLLHEEEEEVGNTVL